MRVARIEMEGLTTSFRYPHFMWGRHPTFDMPPPSTIYGHICSAAGEWLDPSTLEFGYTFTHEGKAEDMEHVHAVSAGTGKPLRQKGRVAFSEPVNTTGAINPLTREFLFKPKMTLYVSPAEHVEAFRSPRYAAVLGRSQDLMGYKSVEVVELEKSPRAYYEHTILPWEMQTRAKRGVTVLMPRYIDYANTREPSFERYVVLSEGRVVIRPPGEEQDDVPEDERPALRFESEDIGHWVDPESPERRGAKRGVWMHGFVD
jgi:CRISPR-associated protein Cas5t